MSRFRTTVILSPVECSDLWILEHPLVFVSTFLDETITIPAGFVYDANSLPRLLRIVVLPTRYPGAAALHDYGYRFGLWPRYLVDALYREALAAEGCRLIPRWLRYIAVRLFGGGAYDAREF